MAGSQSPGIELSPDDEADARQQEAVGREAALSLALSDALSELVQDRGIGFLDTFLERRLRRNAAIFTSTESINNPANTEVNRRRAEAARRALQSVIDDVRRDPSTVT